MSTTSKPSASKLAETVRKWLLIFGTNYSQSVDQERASLWLMAFRDLEAETFHAACEGALQTCRFFPTVADIRAQITQAEEAAKEVEAEQVWQKLLGYTRKWVQGDMPNRLFPGAPALPTIVDYAARAAGGLLWIATCSEERLEWARKNFLEAYKSGKQLEESGHLLSSAEAKRVLHGLVGAARQMLESRKAKNES